MDRIHPEEKVVREEKDIPEVLLPYYQLMINQEVCPDIIDKIISKVQKDLNPHATYDKDYMDFRFKKEISTCFNNIKPIILSSDNKPSIVSFVGSSGVGKTTTLAKLAAQYAIEKRKNVGIITCDTYRIAAVEQ